MLTKFILGEKIRTFGKYRKYSKNYPKHYKNDEKANTLAWV